MGEDHSQIREPHIILTQNNTKQRQSIDRMHTYFYNDNRICTRRSMDPHARSAAGDRADYNEMQQKHEPINQGGASNGSK